MKVHFVCTGNTFRSRLAEAYLRSKKIPYLEVFSSGILARENKNGPITWYGARLLARHGLIASMSAHWKQTTQAKLRQADIVIFMAPKHHEHAKQLLQFQGNRFEVWDIPDLSDYGFQAAGNDTREDLQRIIITEKIFRKIRSKVDTLIASLANW